MRRRAWVRSAGCVVGAGAVVGGYLALSLADDAPVVEPLRTTAAYVREVEHALTFDGTVSTVTRTEPGVTTLVLDAPVDPLVLYDLVPSLDAGGVTTSVSITGRRGTFGCGSLTVLDPPSLGTPALSEAEHGGGAAIRADGAAEHDGGQHEVPSTTPTESPAAEAEAPPAGVQVRHLRCAVPDHVTAFEGLDATLQVTYRTVAGARRTLSLPAPISSETGPSTVVDDRRSVRAAVDPALLYLLAPAIDADQVTGTGSVVGRDEEFPCEAVTLEEDPGGSAAAPPEAASVLAPPSAIVDAGSHRGWAVACRVPTDVEVYDGVAVSLRVSTARADDVLVVPLTAIRTTGAGTGVVALVTGLGADGTEITQNRAVTLGLDDGLVVAVTDGLVEGDVVVDPVTQR